MPKCNLRMSGPNFHPRNVLEWKFASLTYSVPDFPFDPCSLLAQLLYIGFILIKLTCYTLLNVLRSNIDFICSFSLPLQSHLKPRFISRLRQRNRERERESSYISKCGREKGNTTVL